MIKKPRLRDRHYKKCRHNMNSLIIKIKKKKIHVLVDEENGLFVHKVQAK